MAKKKKTKWRQKKRKWAKQKRKAKQKAAEMKTSSVNKRIEIASVIVSLLLLLLLLSLYSAPTQQKKECQIGISTGKKRKGK